MSPSPGEKCGDVVELEKCWGGGALEGKQVNAAESQTSCKSDGDIGVS